MKSVNKINLSSGFIEGKQKEKNEQFIFVICYGDSF